VALGQLTQGSSITLAGTATSDYWSPDSFHPSGVMQGLFSNAVMLGFQEGYGADTSGLQFTDQEILNAAVDAGTPTIHTPTYYNVQPFVVLPSRPIAGVASSSAVDFAFIAGSASEARFTLSSNPVNTLTSPFAETGQRGHSAFPPTEMSPVLFIHKE
jgi:hypothetical protein